MTCALTNTSPSKKTRSSAFNNLSNVPGFPRHTQNLGASRRKAGFLPALTSTTSSPATISKNRHERKESERFKSFSYEDLLKRDKLNLDIFWLKDESLEDSANLPDPDIIA